MKHAIALKPTHPSNGSPLKKLLGHLGGRKVSRVMARTRHVATLAVLLAATKLRAQQYDIGEADDDIFAGVTQFMQSVVNLIDGPVALAVTVISFAIAFGMWAIAPKSGGLAMAARVCIAAIVVLNLATWVAYFQNAG